MEPRDTPIKQARYQRDPGAGSPVHVSSFETDAIVLIKKVTRHAPTPQPENKCRSQLRGVYNYGTGQCDVYSRLSAVCVIAELQRHPDGGDGAAWALNTRDGMGHGCDHSNGWALATYATAAVRSRSSNGGAYGSGAANTLDFGELTDSHLTDVRVTLRESHDPYVATAARARRARPPRAVVISSRRVSSFCSLRARRRFRLGLVGLGLLSLFFIRPGLTRARN